MKLTFIYGPPAVGKLTVARELSAITGHRLLHNHLTADLALALFDYSSPYYTSFGRKLRLDCFAMAVEARITGLICTFCYEAPNDNSFVEDVVRVIEAGEGDVCFVQLYCDENCLLQRVLGPERRVYNKITSPDHLSRALREADFFQQVPFASSLSIDNTKLLPNEVARLVKAHYCL